MDPMDAMNDLLDTGAWTSVRRFTTPLIRRILKHFISGVPDLVLKHPNGRRARIFTQHGCKDTWSVACSRRSEGTLEFPPFAKTSPDLHLDGFRSDMLHAYGVPAQQRLARVLNQIRLYGVQNGMPQNTTLTFLIRFTLDSPSRNLHGIKQLNVPDLLSAELSACTFPIYSPAKKDFFGYTFLPTLPLNLPSTRHGVLQLMQEVEDTAPA